jgi:hypothetical protein
MTKPVPETVLHLYSPQGLFFLLAARPTAARHFPSIFSPSLPPMLRPGF